ncbi:unnamed protein product [Amoebophrya sp. A120]|nr:unnamed protein product [Amoebophrya sp. A120]|eukprot:GSA120T00006612001.1
MGVADDLDNMSEKFLERLEADAVMPLVEAKDKLPTGKIVVDLAFQQDSHNISTAEPSRDHSSTENFATTSVSEEERPLSASLARHRALLQQVSTERKEHNLHLLGEQKKQMRKEAEQTKAASSASSEQARAKLQRSAKLDPDHMRSTMRRSDSFTTLIEEAEQQASSSQHLSQQPASSQHPSVAQTASSSSSAQPHGTTSRSSAQATALTSSQTQPMDPADAVLQKILGKQSATLQEGFLHEDTGTGINNHTWSNFTPQDDLPTGPPTAAQQQQDRFQATVNSSSSTDIMTTQRSPQFDQIQLAQSVENANLKKMLSTPRTLQACKELGIVPSELHIRQVTDFAKVADKGSDSKEKMRIRFQHFETKRQEKLRLVLEARSKIIAREFEKLGAPESGNFYSLQLMEDILDQEAKRLAKKLKQEVRLHAAVERENEEQLLREKQVREREHVRLQKRQIAEQKRLHEAAEIRQRVLQKQEQTKQVKSGLEEYEKARQAQILAVQFEDEIRVREWQQQKQIEQAVKSEQWQQRQELIQQRQLEEQLQNEIKAEHFALRYDEKLDAFEERKAEERKQNMVRHEADHLKIVDAVERRERMQRIDMHRREKVGEQIAEQQTRIDSLMHLKKQLLEQRRQRSRLQDAKSASVKGLNIRHVEPGPGAYDIPGTLSSQGVGKIPEPKQLKPVEGSIAAQVARARDNPPPGSYDPRILPSGEKTLADKPMSLGTRHSGGSFADQALKRNRDKPGPGTYNVSGNFKLNHVANMGKSADVTLYHQSQSGSNVPTWIGKVDRDIPGPGSYAVDEYTRSQRNAKVMSTMPTFQVSTMSTGAAGKKM